ncbi:hypothetical protein BRD17_07910 [Halobacteriales archaeon SW_7_68_16]|nr:MAG: hypothetical protein BRD17_07910 [Halobacteriales archaeon SW_7_68_16]
MTNVEAETAGIGTVADERAALLAGTGAYLVGLLVVVGLAVGTGAIAPTVAGVTDAIVFFEYLHGVPWGYAGEVAVGATRLGIVGAIAALVPVAVPLGAGYLLADGSEVADASGGARAGVGIVAGYLPAATVGQIVVRTSLGGRLPVDGAGPLVAGVDALSVVVLVGGVAPAALGGLGGFLAGWRRAGPEVDLRTGAVLGVVAFVAGLVVAATVGSAVGSSVGSIPPLSLGVWYLYYHAGPVAVDWSLPALAGTLIAVGALAGAGWLAAGRATDGRSDPAVAGATVAVGYAASVVVALATALVDGSAPGGAVFLVLVGPVGVLAGVSLPLVVGGLAGSRRQQ